MKQEVLWIIGSNASGKTTQSKQIHAEISACKPAIIEFDYRTGLGIDGTSFVTSYGTSAHVGKMADNQCTGTDTLSSKEQIDAAYVYSLHTLHRLTILDGIMATGQWYEMIRQADVRLILVHLRFNSLAENLARVKARQASKKNLPLEAFELRESTLDNVARKMAIFNNLFNKFAGLADAAEVIDAGLKSAEITARITKNLRTKI